MVSGLARVFSHRTVWRALLTLLALAAVVLPHTLRCVGCVATLFDRHPVRTVTMAASTVGTLPGECPDHVRPTPTETSRYAGMPAHAHLRQRATVPGSLSLSTDRDDRSVGNCRMTADQDASIILSISASQPDVPASSAGRAVASVAGMPTSCATVLRSRLCVLRT